MSYTSYGKPSECTIHSIRYVYSCRLCGITHQTLNQALDCETTHMDRIPGTLYGSLTKYPCNKCKKEYYYVQDALNCEKSHSRRNCMPIPKDLPVHGVRTINTSLGPYFQCDHCYKQYTSFTEAEMCPCIINEYFKSKENKMSLPKIEVLQRSFEFNERKTLKLRVKESTPLISAINDAREFLADNPEYSRIEFAYDRMYYVVARLKDKE